MYDFGQGVKQDYTEAVRWYRKAAAQGHASAQYELGLRYDLGQGVRQNSSEAVRCYLKAAEQGDAQAQSKRGAMYEVGQRLRKDYVQAYMWMHLAASRSTGAPAKICAKARDRLAAKMSPAQIAEARRRARHWKPTTKP